MAQFFLFRKLLTNLSDITFPTAIAGREISVRPAWLLALVGFFCFEGRSDLTVSAQVKHIA